MLIAQISDLHIKAGGRLSYRVVDTARLLQNCVDRLNNLPQAPDVLVVTGDLVDMGLAEDYVALRELLQPLRMPYYLLPGNHDDRDALRRAFPDHAYLNAGLPFIQYVVDDWPVRIVALDTVDPGQASGRLCARRIGWLDEQLLAAPDRPTIVLMHHPPFATGIGHMDEIGLTGSEELAAVIRRHPQVERILCGHLHRPIQTRFAGTLAMTCPSPAHQVVLDLAPDAASRFVMEPPAFMLHAWSSASGLVSHTAYVGKYDGPYPFYEDGTLID
jgi:3',5'-cyclic-AMP phosphodiesterase